MHDGDLGHIWNDVQWCDRPYTLWSCVETMMTAIIILHDHMGRHNPNSIVIAMVAMVMTMIPMLAVILDILVTMLLNMIMIMMMPHKEGPSNLRGGSP